MKVFLAFARQAFLQGAVYRFQFWLQIGSTLLLMYSSHWLWKNLYAHRQMTGVSAEWMMTYGMLGMALDCVFGADGPHWYIASQVRSGSIDVDLSKPLDFHVHLLARSIGDALFRLVTQAFPVLTVGYLFMGLRLPTDITSAVLVMVSSALGFLVLFSLNFLLGMLAIRTLNIGSISWAYQALVRFFSGQLVPLWLFPGVLLTLAEVLPFKSIYFIPLSIYVGTLTGVAVMKSILFQALWALLLVLSSRFAWRRMHAKLVVQGG